MRRPALARAVSYVAQLLSCDNPNQGNCGQMSVPTGAVVVCVGHIGRHLVRGRNDHWVSRPGQHPRLSFCFMLIDGLVVVHTGQSHQSATKPRTELLLRPVVVDERDGISQRGTGLPASGTACGTRTSLRRISSGSDELRSDGLTDGRDAAP